jgi:hypothetical protein
MEGRREMIVRLPYRGSAMSSNLLARIKKKEQNNQMLVYEYVSKIPGDGHASFHRDSQSEKH